MMCRVNVTTTLEEQSIHVEECDNPNTLVYAAEGDDPEPVARQAWQYMRQHPECPTRDLHLHLQLDLPRWRLKQAADSMIWLLRQMFAASMPPRK